jgi:hypothetical protein
VLAAIGARFDGDGVKLDRGVHNPSRIVRLYGTLAAKGDNTEERPHRLSRILKSTLRVAVTAEQLRALVQELQPEKPEEPNARNNKPDKEQIRKMLAVIPKRPDYHDWIKVLAAVADALDEQDAIEVLNEWSPEEEPGDYAAKLRSGFTEIHIGTLIHLARAHGWTGNLRSDDNEKTIHAKPGTPKVELQALRVAKLTRPALAATINQWRDVIEANFPALVRPAETCLCVVAQLLLNDVSNPFALALVDVPSSGKTIILNFFDGVPELSYTTDNFTPASFVSHASNVRREDLGKVDLLPRIRYRVLIVRELGSVFGAKDDDLIKSFGILTRVLDGEGLETDSGVHGKRGYKGDYVFMLIGGTPPIAPRVFKVMGNFGSRLFFRELHSPDETDDNLVDQNRGEARKQKENSCKTITDRFLRTLWAANQSGLTWNKKDDPEDCLRVIARCSRLLSRLRGAINVWSVGEGGEKLAHNVPVIEKPNRINCLFYNLARGHALICGRRQLTTEDLWPVLDLTFDSAPTTRAKVFRGLIEAGGTLTTSDVEILLHCSPPTARKEMEALAVLGVAKKTSCPDKAGSPESVITLDGRFEWFTSDECTALMKDTYTRCKSFHLRKENASPRSQVKEIPPCICEEAETSTDNAADTVIGGELTQQAVAMEIASMREEEQLAVAREIAAIREEERKWKDEQERNRKKKAVSGIHTATPEEKLHL